MKVLTPGSNAQVYGEDDSSGEESEPEVQINVMQMFGRNSSTNVKEIKAVLQENARKHKLSPENDVLRSTQNKLSLSSIVGLGHS